MYYWKLEKSYSFVQHIWDNKKNSPLETSKYADFDELDAKKKEKLSKCQNFEVTPPPVVKIHNFFFSNDKVKNVQHQGHFNSWLLKIYCFVCYHICVLQEKLQMQWEN